MKTSNYKPKSKQIRDGFVRYTLYIREEFLIYLKEQADKKRVWVTDIFDEALTDFCEQKKPK